MGVCRGEAVNLDEHERKALIWALSDPDPLHNAELDRKVIFAIGGVPDFASCVATHKQRFAAMIFDPAKLAELMASALRARGVAVELLPPRARVDYDHHEDPPHGACRVVAFMPDGFQHRVDIEWIPSEGLCLCMLLPTARAKLLAIMQTTADPASRETCERILRGTNGV